MIKDLDNRMCRNRETNVELLRIISMFLIVLIHALGKTEAINNLEKGTGLYFAAWMLWGMCRMGNNVLVIITGYFGSKMKIKYHKIASLWFQVLFYSVALAMVAKYLLHINLVTSKKEVFFPFVTGQYWFFSVYVVLYFFIPYINLLLERLTHGQFTTLIVVLTVFQSIIPTVFGYENWLNSGGAYSCSWFVYMYLIGAYLFKYRCRLEKIRTALVFCVCVIVPPLLKCLLESLCYDSYFARQISVLNSSSSVFYVISSAALFLLFLNVKIDNSVIDKVILFFAKSCFGIYLLHNNRNISHYIWEKMRIKYWLAIEKNLFVVVFLSFLVFVVCGVIENIRIYFFRRMGIDHVIKSISSWIEAKIKGYLQCGTEIE